MKASEASERIARHLEQRMPTIIEQSIEWGMIQQDTEEQKAEWIRLCRAEVLDCLLEMQREEVDTIQKGMQKRGKEQAIQKLKQSARSAP